MSRSREFDVSLFIVTEYGEYVLPNEYDSETDGNGIFVCLMNDELNPEYGDNNTIYIYNNWKDEMTTAKKEMARNNRYIEWSTSELYCTWTSLIYDNIDCKVDMDYNLSEHEKHSYLKSILNGQRENDEIISKVGKNSYYQTKDHRATMEEKIPAFMVAYHTKAVFNNKIYHGFLPSIGQLLYISHNARKINPILSRIVTNMNSSFKLVYETWISENFWSSTKCERRHAFYLYDGREVLNGNISQDKFNVLPIFSIV